MFVWLHFPDSALGHLWLSANERCKSQGLQWPSLAIRCPLYGPIGVIAAAGLPDRNLRRTMRLIVEAQGVDVDGLGQNDQPTNSAPLCDEEIEKQRRRAWGINAKDMSQ